jgi:hypothetical protein
VVERGVGGGFEAGAAVDGPRVGASACVLVCLRCGDEVRDLDKGCFRGERALTTGYDSGEFAARVRLEAGVVGRVDEVVLSLASALDLRLRERGGTLG